MEMFRLQGMDHTKFVVAVPDRAIGQQLGNAMSVNVVERVLLRALIAADLLSEATVDGWKNGARLQRLQDIRGHRFNTILGSHFDGEKRVTRTIVTARNGRSARHVIVDSGASFHMVNRDDLTDEERATIRPMKIPRLITTANGVIEIDTECDFWIEALHIWVVATVLPDAPSLLSLGRLVKYEKLDYIWRHGSLPYLQTPNGHRVICSPTHDVPFICTLLPLKDPTAMATTKDNVDARSNPSQPPDDATYF